MQVLDKISAQLETMTRDLRAFPVPEACAEHGVKVPSSGTFRDMDQLDLMLNDAFGVLDLNSLAGKRKWQAKVALKSSILAAGLVAEKTRIVAINAP
jgi:hypothetical protein